MIGNLISQIGQTVTKIDECKSKKYGSVIGDEMYVWVNPWADDFSNKVAKEKLQKITSVIDPVVRSELLGAKLVFVTENIESKNSLLKK